MNKYIKYIEGEKNHYKGQIDLITKQNDENGWVVARLVPDDGRAPIKIIGTIPGLKTGESLEVEGHWEDSNWGRQLRVDKVKMLMPTTIKGIEVYLGSGIIPGIGPKTAKKLTRHFKNKIIKLSDDKEIAYEELIIATGASPFIPPIKGTDLIGVTGFKTEIDSISSELIVFMSSISFTNTANMCRSIRQKTPQKSTHCK